MKRTKEEAEQTKKKLIDIALREFIKYGYENITLEKIAAKAGVTRGAIYWHFKNKEDLLDSLIKIKDTESVVSMKEIYESKKPVMERLYLMVLGNFPPIKERRQAENYAKIKVDLYNYYLKNGDVRKVGETFLKYTSSLLKEAQSQDKIKKTIDAYDTAYLIYTIIGGLMMRFSVNPGKHKSMNSLKNVLKNFIKQIEN